MTKRTKIFVALAIISILGFISVYIADSFLHLGLFSHNSIEVTVDKPLYTQKIKIQKGHWTINRTSDKILFESSSDNEIVYNNSSSFNINSDYGENDFLVTYDEKYYYQFRHFIFNRRHYHDYHFHFSEVDGKVKLSVNIDGADGMEFEKNMNLISNAGGMKTNVPKEKAGTIYNMKELETR